MQCSVYREQLATFLQPSGAGVRLALPSFHISPCIILHKSLALLTIDAAIFSQSHLSFQGPYFVSSIYFPLLFNASRSFSIILPQPSFHCHFLSSTSLLSISLTPLASILQPLPSTPSPSRVCHFCPDSAFLATAGDDNQVEEK